MKIPKRTRRDPFFYLGIISLVLFLILISFSRCRILEKTIKDQLASSLNPQNLFLASGGNLFIEPPDLFLVQENSIKSASSPMVVNPQTLGSLVGSLDIPETKNEVFEYVVQEGDTLSVVAEKFDISLNTLLWANDLSKKSVITPGKKLIILPVSGLIHHVTKGDTLSEIAEIYEADLEKIISLNELSEEEIFAGDILIIPDGIMPSRAYSSAPSQVPLASSYFICPIPSPCRISYGLHWYNAIDFSNGKCGEAVYAVAGGTIQKTGYGNISGNFVRIEHPNGVITSYGHLSKILVSPGQSVAQGARIGFTGYSGYTIPAGPSGCHLHFEVRGARNPFSL